MNQKSSFASVGPLAWSLLAVLALAGCAGKGSEGICPALSECGGDPMGTWGVAAGCQYPADAPYQELNLSEFVQVPLAPSIAPEQLQPTTKGDWCSNLVYMPADANNPTGKVQAVNLWHGAPQIQSGSITFAPLENPMPGDPTGAYTTQLLFARNDLTHFAPSCLTANGAAPTCADLATNLAAFYVEKTMGRNELPDVPSLPGFEQISCGAASDGGCDCVYRYSVSLYDQGTWTKSGSKLTETSDYYYYNGLRVNTQAPTQPMVAGFCRSGNQLQLTGDEGASLSQAVGLRTLTLAGM